MLVPEVDVEPLLVDFYSSDEDCFSHDVDALWGEVGELLTQFVPAELDDEQQQKQPQVSSSPKKQGVKPEKKRSVIPSACLESMNIKRQNLSDERTRQEIRMARNRASAERTRVRRLEQIKYLELRSNKLEEMNLELISTLENCFQLTRQEIDKLTQVKVHVEVIAEPVRRFRIKKSDASVVLQKLESDSLSKEEIAKLRNEARMARNRASAERTRLRRLEATKVLEARVFEEEVKNEKLKNLLIQQSSTSSCSEEVKIECNNILRKQEEYFKQEGSNNKPQQLKCCLVNEDNQSEAFCETRPARSTFYKIILSPYLFLVTCKLISDGFVTFNAASFVVENCLFLIYNNNTLKQINSSFTNFLF